MEGFQVFFWWKRHHENSETESKQWNCGLKNQTMFKKYWLYSCIEFKDLLWHVFRIHVGSSPHCRLVYCMCWPHMRLTGPLLTLWANSHLTQLAAQILLSWMRARDSICALVHVGSPAKLFSRVSVHHQLLFRSTLAGQACSVVWAHSFLSVTFQWILCVYCIYSQPHPLWAFPQIFKLWVKF